VEVYFLVYTFDKKPAIMYIQLGVVYIHSNGHGNEAILVGVEVGRWGEREVASGGGSSWGIGVGIGAGSGGCVDGSSGLPEAKDRSCRQSLFAVSASWIAWVSELRVKNWRCGP